MSIDKDEPDKKCPIVNEWLRHVLYVGGMVVLHSGFGASVMKSKHDKCPVSEWARHAVYVGGFVALAVKAGMAATTTKQIEGEKEAKTACPVNELYRHALYIGGMIGVVAMINAKKK